MAEIPFNEYEVELVRFFAHRYTDGEEIVNMKEFPATMKWEKKRCTIFGNGLPITDC